jgi:hypothetical protein
MGWGTTIKIGTFNRHESCPADNYILDHIEDMFDFKAMYEAAAKYFSMFAGDNSWRHPDDWVHFIFYPSGLTQGTIAVLDAFNTVLGETVWPLSVHIWNRETEQYEVQTWGANL